MSKTIGLLGIGSIGYRHLTNLLNIENDIDAVFIFDRDQAAIDRALAIRDDRVKAVTGPEEIINHALDLVLICTPNGEHFKDSQSFVQEGIPVFIEKPMVLDAAQGHALLEHHNSKIIVGANMRYHPALIKAKQIVESGSLGTIVSARAFFGHDLANWRPGSDYHLSYSANPAVGGGVLWDGIHELDYLIWLFGEVVDAEAFLSNRDVLGIEVEENADLMLRHGDGLVTTVHLDYIQPLKQRGLEILGSKGVLKWTSKGKNPESIMMGIQWANRFEPLLEEKDVDPNEAYIEQLLELLEFLDDEKRGPGSLLFGKDALHEVELIQKMRNKHH